MNSPDVEQDDLVTALRYDEAAVVDELAQWCAGEVESPETGAPVIWVPTLKGPRPACLGDWIVRRGWGDYYPCSAADFAAKHEPLR